MAVADECSLCNTLAYKFGYGTDIEKFKKEASDKFSLLKDGTLDMPRCARLFLVNVRSPSPFSFIPTPLSTSLEVVLTRSPGHRRRDLPHRRLLSCAAAWRAEGGAVSLAFSPALSALLNLFLSY